MIVLIGFYNDNAKSGGAEGILRQIAEYHLGYGDEVHLLFQKKKRYGHWEEISQSNLFLYYGGNCFRRFWNIIKLRKLTIDYSYSSIVRVTGPLGLMKRLGLLRIKTMVGRESTSIFIRYKGWRLLYFQMWYLLGYKAIDILICQTFLMKQQLLEHLPWLERNSKVVVIPNPVNLSQIKFLSNKSLDVTNYAPYIISAGRFIPEKAYDVLLDAFFEVKKKFKDIKLVILGEGPLKNQVEHQIEKLHLSDSVFLEGHVDNVYPWFKNASLCVISSRIEGFPNVLLQMMSQNDKVVTTLCAGDIDKIKGLSTCEVNNPIALANSIINTLESHVPYNRQLFDRELESRSINKFIEKIEITNKI